MKYKEIFLLQPYEVFTLIDRKNAIKYYRYGDLRFSNSNKTAGVLFYRKINNKGYLYQKQFNEDTIVFLP